MNRNETTRIVGLLITAGLVGTPDAETLPKTIALYAELLEDVPFDAAMRGVRDYLTDTTPGSDGRPSARFWMTVADIRHRVEKQDEPRRIGEWERILRALSRGEPLGEITPPIEAGLKAAGGSFAIKTRLEKDTATMRAAFVEAHRKTEAAHPLITVTAKETDHA